MTDARIQKEPGPDHPITTEPPRPMVVRSGTTVIAETDRTLELQEAGYPPVLYGTDLTAAALVLRRPLPHGRRHRTPRGLLRRPGGHHHLPQWSNRTIDRFV